MLILIAFALAFAAIIVDESGNKYLAICSKTNIRKASRSGFAFIICGCVWALLRSKTYIFVHFQPPPSHPLFQPPFHRAWRNILLNADTVSAFTTLNFSKGVYFVLQRIFNPRHAAPTDPNPRQNALNTVCSTYFNFWVKFVENTFLKFISKIIDRFFRWNIQKHDCNIVLYPRRDGVSFGGYNLCVCAFYINYRGRKAEKSISYL